MTLLPFEKFTIESSLNKHDVIIALMKNIDPPKLFRPVWEDAPTEFEGELKKNEFEIKRIIRYRNSFQPVIRGKIEGFGNKTRLIVEMRISVMAGIFMTVWCGFLAIGLVWLLIQGDTDLDSIGIPCAMLLFGYGLVMGGYLHESRKAKNLLLTITRGKVVNLP